MSAIDALGLVVHMFLLSTCESEPRSVLKGYYKTVKSYCGRYGTVTALILVTFFSPDAPRLINRIENHVLKTESQHQVEEFMKSLVSSFNMVGVAGAIVAQAGMAGLALNATDNIHWTVNAFWIVGLLFGSFSVAFACLVHPALRGLDSPANIRDWLSQPSEPGILGNSEPVHASAYAVMMLLAPSRLLNIALSTLLTGLGVYMVLLYTGTAEPALGRSGALAILVVYVCIGVLGVAIYVLPQGMKDIESRRSRRLANKVNQGQRPTSTSSAFSHSSQVARTARRRWEHDPKLLATVTPRRLSDATSETHEEYELDEPGPSSKRSDTATLELAEDGRSDMTTSMSSSTALHKQQQRRNDLDTILKRLVAVQEEYTNANQRLLKYLQD